MNKINTLAEVSAKLDEMDSELDEMMKEFDKNQSEAEFQALMGRCENHADKMEALHILETKLIRGAS